MLEATLGALTIGCLGLTWKVHEMEDSVADIREGHQRREAYPLHAAVTESAQMVLDDASLKVERELCTLSDGRQLFYQIVEPIDGSWSHLVIGFHGFCENSDRLLGLYATLARRGAKVVLLDLPGHGRSDGTLGHVPDWWAWVAQITEFLDAVVRPMRFENGKVAKMFGSGHSLGGGLTAFLAVSRPSLFDGVVLLAPLLSVGNEARPPKMIEDAARYALSDTKSDLPITPVTSNAEVHYRLGEQGEKEVMTLPMSTRGLPPRLATGNVLGFVLPDWIERNMHKMQTPFLILHGTEDKVTDPAKSQKFYEESPVSDKQIKLYEGVYHAEIATAMEGNSSFSGVEFLPEQLAVTAQVADDMAGWFDARL